MTRGTCTRTASRTFIRFFGRSSSALAPPLAPALTLALAPGVSWRREPVGRGLWNGLVEPGGGDLMLLRFFPLQSVRTQHSEKVFQKKDRHAHTHTPHAHTHAHTIRVSRFLLNLKTHFNKGKRKYSYHVFRVRLSPPEYRAAMRIANRRGSGGRYTHTAGAF